MISISTDHQRCPTIQMFVMLHALYKKPDLEEIKKYIVQRDSQVSTYMMRVQDLKSRNIKFDQEMILERKYYDVEKKNVL